MWIKVCLEYCSHLLYRQIHHEIQGQVRYGSSPVLDAYRCESLNSVPTYRHNFTGPTAYDVTNSVMEVTVTQTYATDLSITRVF